MQKYDPKQIEPKWQAKWEADKIYQASEDPAKPKKYVLEYFPYPSGAAMHVGHVRNYTIGDAIARYNRMRGYNVLHPMGWDAFGLPAENYAIKTGISPRKAVDENTKKFKKQLMQMGFSYDWSREIDSTDPKYYKWTQWFFLLLHKRGLAYQQESLQWWCPVDKTVLANEQVEAGKCWRCGSTVEKKALKQWFFKITEYADRLLADLDDLDWSDAIKSMQRNWIGRSVGAEVDFVIASEARQSHPKITVFTTRPDTLFGATFMVLAPEHPLVSKLTVESQKSQVESYVRNAEQKSDIQRQETDREKTGVFTGSYAINPVNDEKIPVWIADYVMMGYGTGAIMAVPAHDERDWEFAQKFDLPITEVILPERAEGVEGPSTSSGNNVFTGEGVMQNSGSYDGMATSDAREKIVVDLADKKVAEEKVNYKMRDWLISRQRYWGAPIPIIHCPKDGAVAVPEDQLPVELPELTKFEPSGDGRSPLANVPEFVNTTCPTCGGPAERETDTMDGFACSSWYFLRFADPNNDKLAFDKDKAEFWLPVDDYIGGAEHAVMHLLYARFWTKVMFDEGLINFQEPFTTLRNHGMILAPDGSKMSKSKNNTIEPDGLIEQGYGADATRIMELFIGPWDQVAAWSVEGMSGASRFLYRVWALVQEHLSSRHSGPEASTNKDNASTQDPESLKPIDQEILNQVQDDSLKQLERATQTAIKKVSQDMHELGFNTAVAALMEYVNELYKFKAKGPVTTESLNTLVQLLAPIAPHIAEELWEQLGQKGSVHTSQWPEYDESKLVQDAMTVVVQVNGKLRGNIEVPSGADEDAVVAAAKADTNVQKHLGDIVKTIYVPGKLVNFVIK